MIDSIQQEDVLDRIFDFRDSRDIARVEYFPYLLSEDYSDISYNITRASLIGDNSTIKGTLLLEDAVIPLEGTRNKQYVHQFPK